MRNLIFLIAACVCFTENIRADYNDFETNPYITLEARDNIRPFLLPKDHKMKARLDKIFHETRAIFDDRSLKKAGFDIKFKQPRSFIYVVSHDSMPGYLLKLVPDVELRNKGGRPEWYWFVNRCIGVQKVHDVIKKHQIKYFAAPKKWIYPLPVNPYPAKESKRSNRKIVVLLVENMLLTSKEENKIAWKKEISKKHLDELYLIIKEVGGRSYRAENIPQTKKGTFAFVDTEYPTSPPGFRDIRKFLSSGKRLYWDKLVEAGKQ
jgi:hypothetical protein